MTSHTGDGSKCRFRNLYKNLGLWIIKHIDEKPNILFDLKGEEAQFKNYINRPDGLNKLTFKGNYIDMLTLKTNVE